MKHKDPWVGVLAPQENPNKQVLEWYDNFVDYVMQYDSNVYNSACEYADKKERGDEELTENGLTAEDVKEYY